MLGKSGLLKLCLSSRPVIILLLLSIFLLEGRGCVPAKAQAQPVIATDYSFYKGPLDAGRRPIMRVNGYLRNESSASLWIAIAYLEDMPEVTARSQFYGPDGKLVQQQMKTFGARKSGDSAVWYLATNAIHQLKNSTGIWKVDVYYGPYYLLTENFSVGDYLVDIYIAGLPGNLTVKIAVDGEGAGTIRGGEQKPSALTFGMHTISANATVSMGESARYVLDSNSLVVSSQSSHTFRYHAEYYVRVGVNSPYGRTVGSGWYARGTNATFSADSPLAAGPGVRYVFTGWSGNYVADAPEGSIVVDGPKNIIANYRLQYYLLLKSEYGHPRGEGWYDEGSTASISVPRSLVLPDGTKIFFLRWSGAQTSSNNSVTLVMDRPYSITAEWEVTRPTFQNVTSLYLILGAYGLVVTVAVALLFLSMRRRPGTRRKRP
jgi:hypothetical protein